jgi:hypothetical protein
VKGKERKGVKVEVKQKMKGFRLKESGGEKGEEWQGWRRMIETGLRWYCTGKKGG